MSYRVNAFVFLASLAFLASGGSFAQNVELPEYPGRPFLQFDASVHATRSRQDLDWGFAKFRRNLTQRDVVLTGYWRPTSDVEFVALLPYVERAVLSADWISGVPAPTSKPTDHGWADVALGGRLRAFPRIAPGTDIWLGALFSPNSAQGRFIGTGVNRLTLRAHLIYRTPQRTQAYLAYEPEFSDGTSGRVIHSLKIGTYVPLTERVTLALRLHHDRIHFDSLAGPASRRGFRVALPVAFARGFELEPSAFVGTIDGFATTMIAYSPQRTRSVGLTLRHFLD